MYHLPSRNMFFFGLETQCFSTFHIILHSNIILAVNFDTIKAFLLVWDEENVWARLS